MVAVIVHYFGSAPLLKVMTQEDPLSPERLAPGGPPCWILFLLLYST